MAVAAAATVALRALPPLARAVAVALLAAAAAWHTSACLDVALHTSLRAQLDVHVGGFASERLGPPPPHDPVPTRIELVEDASASGSLVSLRARVRAIWLAGEWLDADGGLSISVGGSTPADRAAQWLAGRVLQVPLTFRRPARYLNEGVGDFERDLALDGTTLFASTKSGLLVEVLRPGDWFAELAARCRLRTRREVTEHVGRHSPVTAAVVTAVLIGDRTGLPDALRLRLQAAGTYHVIAISGGNIAILALLIAGGMLLTGAPPRAAAGVTLVVLLAYAFAVTAGSSVWRATAMAAIYLAARLLDHRTPPWHSLAVAALLALAWHPLDVGDAGFLLTFGATGALLETARRHAMMADAPPWRRWLVTTLLASLAVEVALLPIAATTFSRVTAAGLVLNLMAVPAMAVAQVAGLAVVLAGPLDAVAEVAGWIAHMAVTALAESARLVEIAPWMTMRVPPPAVVVICIYYAALGAALWRTGHVRWIAAIVWVLAASVIVTGSGTAGRLRTAGTPSGVRLTMFDVGQGESMLLELPDGSRTLIDAGGAPFGGGGFDIGGRVLAPALWARGVRDLAALLITHGDPDHRGGAPSVVTDFHPQQLWAGVPVPTNLPLSELRGQARASGATVRELRTGDAWTSAGAKVRVLHPPVPDWERPRVRNDDSVVLEVVHGDVAILLTGDISDEIEQAIVPMLTPAKARILKVAHHGSRSSTSRELLEAWRPTIALVSAGRGNTFGHPAPQVLDRLASVGARIYRTDRDGQITLTTDGRSVQVATFIGPSWPAATRLPSPPGPPR